MAKERYEQYIGEEVMENGLDDQEDFMKITRGLLMEIVEAFEDFLDEKGVEIPNEEKDKMPFKAPNICGDDYCGLCDALSDVLLRNGAEEGRFE